MERLDFLWSKAEPGDYVMPDLEPEVGMTVRATITRFTIERVGRDAYGDGIYQAQRTQEEVTGFITHINLEGEATVCYYDEDRGCWRTGTFDLGALTVTFEEMKTAR